jgi:hypothetical protein
VSTKHVFFTTNLEPFEQGGTPIASFMLHSISRSVSFYWNGLVEANLHSYTRFQIRVEANYKKLFWSILDEGASASILSSSTWKVMGSPKHVLSPH